MNGDILALIMGCAAAAIYIGSWVHIRRIREEGRDELMKEFLHEKEREGDRL